MFNELTVQEQYETDGGVWPLIVKGIVVIGGVIFLAGAVKGCTDEAAK